MATLKIEDIEAPIDVIFKQRVAQMIAMGEKGVVLFAHKNESLVEEGAEKTHQIREFTSSLNTGIEDEDLKDKVVAIFDGGAKEVILFEHSEALETYVDTLEQYHFDWFVSDFEDDQETVATYCAEREIFGVAYNVAKDNIYAVNFTNPKVTTKE